MLFHVGFRIGVAGYNPSKIARHSLVSSVFSFPRSNIKSVSGLARILLIRSAYKYCDDHTRIFTRIRGTGSDLKKTEKEISNPPRDHDYAQVDFSSKFFGLHIFNRKIEKKINYLQEQKILQKKPFFEFALNDIQKIIKPTPDQQISSLPSRIEWITIEPGRQSIGSFHPSDK